MQQASGDSLRTTDLTGSLSRLRQKIALFDAMRECDEPLISIITPTWNTKSSWLLELALSILNQSFLCWEWCIVDDGSSRTEFHLLFDELRALPNIKISRLPDSGGISRATNAGLEMAAGKYVCFVDHDDILARQALARCVNVLDGNFDAVYTDSDKIDNEGEPHRRILQTRLVPGIFSRSHVCRALALCTPGSGSHHRRV